VEIEGMIASGDYGNADAVSARSKELKHELSSLRKDMIRRLNDSDGSLRIDFVYLNLVQESHELLSEVRNLLRGCRKFYV
jgi:Na+/phosphate symporter